MWVVPAWLLQKGDCVSCLALAHIARNQLGNCTALAFCCFSFGRSLLQPCSWVSGNPQNSVCSFPKVAIAVAVAPLQSSQPLSCNARREQMLPGLLKKQSLQLVPMWLWLFRQSLCITLTFSCNLHVCRLNCDSSNCDKFSTRKCRVTFQMVFFMHGDQSVARRVDATAHALTPECCFPLQLRCTKVE